MIDWVSSINDIPASQWDALQARGSVLGSHAFLRAVERSQLQGVDTLYLHASINGRPVVTLPCFVFSVDAVLLAPSFVRSLATAVRRLWPGFLQLRLLFVGSPLATCDVHAGLPLHDDAALMTAVFDALVERQRQERCVFLMLKEVPDRARARFEAAFPGRFAYFPSLPTSRIPLLPQTLPYPATLRKSYRRRVAAALKQSERAGHRWEVVQEYAPLAQEFHELYLQVRARSDSKFEELTVTWVEEMARCLPNSTSMLTCRNAAGRLIAAALLVSDAKCLTPLYIGLDYAETEGSSVYYNLIFRSAAEAERLGKQQVVLGQNSYAAKANSGAVFEELWLGIHSGHWFGRLLIRHIFRFIFKSTPLPRTVHTDQAQLDSAFRHACEA